MGMPTSVSASASSSASGRLDQTGNAFEVGGNSGWSVNLGGSGTSNQNASSGALAGLSTPMLVAAAVVVLWLLYNKR